MIWGCWHTKVFLTALQAKYIFFKLVSSIHSRKKKKKKKISPGDPGQLDMHSTWIIPKCRWPFASTTSISWALRLFASYTRGHTHITSKTPCFPPHLEVDISFQHRRITLQITGLTYAQTERELCERTRPEINIFPNLPFLGQRQKAKANKRLERCVCLSSQRTSNSLLNGDQTWLPTTCVIYSLFYFSSIW